MTSSTLVMQSVVPIKSIPSYNGITKQIKTWHSIISFTAECNKYIDPTTFNVSKNGSQFAGEKFRFDV